MIKGQLGGWYLLFQDFPCSATIPRLSCPLNPVPLLALRMPEVRWHFGNSLSTSDDDDDDVDVVDDADDDLFL